jgi:hypothetical protein
VQRQYTLSLIVMRAELAFLRLDLDAGPTQPEPREIGDLISHHNDGKAPRRSSARSESVSEYSSLRVDMRYGNILIPAELGAWKDDEGLCCGQGSGRVR